MANNNSNSEINELLIRINDVLNPPSDYAQKFNTVVKENAAKEYIYIYERIANHRFEDLIKGCEYDLRYNHDDLFLKVIELSKTVSTLRKYARAIRYVHFEVLKLEYEKIKRISDQNNNLISKRHIDKLKELNTLATVTELARLLPEDYKNSWQEIRLINEAKFNQKLVKSKMSDEDLYKQAEINLRNKRKKPHSKKYSLTGIPENWLEILAKSVDFKSQFALPALISMVTGCRPSEVEQGVVIEFNHNGNLTAHISGTKVTEHAGQPDRTLELPHNTVTNLIKEALIRSNQKKLTVKVEHGNSITKYICRLSNKLWPRKKSSITCYSIRHHLAEVCKEACSRGLVDRTFTPKVKGHRVDKTINEYGLRRNSNSKKRPVRNLTNDELRTIIPIRVKVTHEIKQKNKSIYNVRFKNSSSSKPKF